MANPSKYPEHADKVFSFVLAEKLGMTVTELHDRMTAAELNNWAAFYHARNAYKDDEMRKQRAQAKATRGR